MAEMTEISTQLQEVLSAALKLTPRERKWLLDRVAAVDTPKVKQPTNEVVDATWTDEEIRALTSSSANRTAKSGAEIVAWLNENPSSGEWGGMKPEDDPAEFIHNLRRQRRSDWDDPIPDDAQ